MIYHFVCACGHDFDSKHLPNELSELKKSGLPCPKCGDKAAYKFDPSTTTVNFVGMAWHDKNYKEKEYRKNRSAYMKQKQRDHVFTPKLVPNYKGQRLASWKEAQAEAAADGKVHESYKALVEKESKS